uniref:Piezo domain-containing protein n=1 Tax=Ciona savignyi TaxID=51511 RepID=H2YLP9_CIOSA
MVVAGTAYPSVVSSIYLISFIILAMMWAFHVKLLTPAVALLRAFLCAIASFQLLMLYLYQIQHIQDLIPKESIYTRLFGLTPIIRTNCTTPHQLLLYPGLKWSVFVEPSGVFLLLWSMAVGVRIDGDNLKTKEKKQFGKKMVIRLKTEKSLHGSCWSDIIHPQVWSVTYHSWLTFVLLIWACGLWMVKERSWYTLCCSPVFTIYGIPHCGTAGGNIVVGWGDLNESELPTVINQTDGNKLYLSAFGIRRYEYPFLHLGIQILYLCGFWLVLHQFNYIRKHGGSGSTNGGLIDGSFTTEADTDSWAYRLGEYCKEMLSRYWIFVVIGFHIAIATEGYPSGTKIIYFALFVLSTVSFVISWQFFRKSLQLYWIVLVTYTMIVLGLIYTYQFQDFPKYWKQLTHFTDQQTLVSSSITNPFELMLSILLPALFLLVVVLQLQYFNDRFLEVNDAILSIDGDGHTGEEGSAEEYEMGELNSGTREDDESWLTRQCRKMCPVVIGSIKTAVSLFIRGMEFHLWRLVFITAFAVAAYKVSAIYATVVVFWVLMLPARVTHRSLYIVTTVGLSLVGMAIMFLQLHFINLQLPYNCTVTVHVGCCCCLCGLLFVQQNMSRWIGIEKMNRNGIFFNHINGLIAILLMISFERVISLRQQWRSKWLKEVRPTVTAFYPSVTWRDADKGLVEFCKYFANFAFYKFGVEACFVMSVVTIWVRADMYAIIYSLLLVIALVLKTRLSLHRYWKFYSVALIILLVWQYLICLGMPPVWCVANQYPWMKLGSNVTEHDRLVRWMFLPDYLIVQDSTALIADFFQLLFVIAQLFVFEHENGEWTQFGGDNRYLTGADLDQVTLVGNPRKNFMLKKARSVLDQLKGFTFKYMIWVTMAMVFVAGTTRISLFCLGYLISFFYLLSRHQELMMGAPSRLLLVWNVVLGYNVSVITLKVALQVISCVYIETLQQRACSVVQLLSLVCSKRASYGLDAPSTTDQTCELSYTNAGLTWDFICFLFLLTQRRIFSSYYFLHASEDLKISMQLAAR